MNITVIYANKRKENSCTYGIAQELTGQLLDGGRLHEFYLPWDMPHVCTGCYACINGHPERCGGYPHLKPILDAFADSELLVFCSPVYAFHTPGQMKTLLDHLAYRWLLHQWDGGMMRKQAVIICTAGGGGLKSAAKDIRDSMEFWGVARTWTITASVWGYNWPELPADFRQRIDRQIDRTVKRVRAHRAHLTPSCKVRVLYTFFRHLHRQQKLTEVDDRHWREHGYNEGPALWKRDFENIGT